MVSSGYVNSRLAEATRTAIPRVRYISDSSRSNLSINPKKFLGATLRERDHDENMDTNEGDALPVFDTARLDGRFGVDRAPIWIG